MPLLYLFGPLLSSSQELPKGIPASPFFAEIMKYGDCKVGNFTGVPDISIPLYVIKEGDIEVPVVLKYHAAGSKPDMVNGMVGMGWTLHFGPNITRTVRNKKDEYNANIYEVSQDQFNGKGKEAQIDSLYYWGKYVDTEPDLFSYNLNGEYGKFILDKQQGLSALLMPYKPLKVLPSVSSSNINFQILDERGFKFDFTQVDYSNSDDPSLSAITGWSISRITSPKSALHYVDFTYASSNIEMNYRRVDKTIIDDNASGPSTTEYCGAIYSASIYS